MTIAVRVQKTSHLENSKVVLAEITMDNSYPTGGEAVVPSDFGLSGIDAMICGLPPVGGFVPSYLASTGKVKLFASTTGTPSALVEFTNTGDASAAVIPVVVWGY